MATAYEAVYIVDATLPGEQVTAIIEKYSAIVTRNGGNVDDIDIWEPRKLAYEIKGHREGRYIVVNFTSEPAAKNELDRIFGISDDVIRHMIVKQDPKADRNPSRTRSAEQERRERDAAARAASVTIAPQPVTDLGTPDTEEAEVETAATEESGEA